MSNENSNPLKDSDWEVVIGLEVHAQITSNAKLFSGASTAFGGAPNAQVSFVDSGFPGVLPVINRTCVKQAIKTGLGLNAKINPISVFDRKNYFYADLPAGYQISQYLRPIVGEGYLDIDLEDGTSKRIGITRLHLEQDAGKSMHDQHPTKSYIDLNRSGVALMEIVTEPDLRSAEEVSAFIKKMRALLRALGTCDGNMEEGSMRADVNVSLHKKGDELGTRAEIKNMNSVRFISQAIKYEIERQKKTLEEGGEVNQETRLFDVKKGITRSMRTKENVHDYRYFPDPDLPPLVIPQEEIDAIKEALPELPDAKKKRFQHVYSLQPYDALVLTEDSNVASYYEETVKNLKHREDPKAAKLLANWMTGEFFALLNKSNISLCDCKILAEQLAQLIDLILDNVISGKIAKDVFASMWETGKNPINIVEAKGLKQISDEGVLESTISEILSANADKVEQYRAGKDKLFGFFVGQVMKELQGKANPQVVNELLKKLLSK